MEISRIRALRGPNLWSRHTAIEAVVACDEAERSIAKLHGFETRLRKLLPGIGDLRGGVRGKGATVSLAHVLQAATLCLQAESGCLVTFGRTSSTAEPGVYQVVVEYTEEAVGRRAFDFATQLVQAALASGRRAAGKSAGTSGSETTATTASLALGSAPSFNLQSAIAELRALDESVRLGPSTGCIVDAAVARGIPYRRLSEGSLVQFGWGSRQRRIWAAEIDSTSAVSEAIAQDKELTKQLLLAAGVPVPQGRPVASVDEAWQAAEEIGLPIVVKPQFGNQGKGVTVNVVSREHMEIAFRAAAEYGEVLVERFLAGSDFRLLVVGDRLVAASRRDPPQVIGDGVHTVAELVDKVNTDPRRGEGHATALTRIRIDEIAVARLEVQGLTTESVPEFGRRVVLRNNANLSTGGTATDVTDDVHPTLAASAVAAAQMVGLHVCGVDVVCESVLHSLEDQRGGIVEVNAAPGLRMHLSPSYGKPRQVGEAIIADLFGHDLTSVGHSSMHGGSHGIATGSSFGAHNGRIPVVAVTGTNGKTTTARLIAHLFASGGLRVGMTNTDGVYVNGRQIDSGDCSGPKSARSVLMHPDVDGAVFETARGGMLREGLGFDRCHVAVVTNIGSGDHLGLNYITTVEDLAVLKRVIVQNVATDGYAVLNAADKIVAAMASSCPGKVIFFAADRHHPVMATHRAQGGRTVYVARDSSGGGGGGGGAGDMLVAAEGSWRSSIPLADIPLTRGGSIAFQVENAMASVAAAWGAGIEWDAIHSGLASFTNDSDNAPGRFNVMDYKGATLIADYGHNPDAMHALVAAVEAMPAKRRSVVISGAGDRRDDDIREQTVILGKAFDEVVLYQDAAQRGRADGEVMALLRDGLKDAVRTRDVIEVRGEFAAIDLALSRLSAGDLCLVLIDQVEEALGHLRMRMEGAVEGGRHRTAEL